MAQKHERPIKVTIMASHVRFSPRVRLLAVSLLAIGGLFVVRLFYLQIVEHDFYTKKALAEQVNQYTLFPTRGVIYAKDGTANVPLVLNQEVYLVFIDPSIVTQPDKIKSIVRQVAGGEAVSDIDAALNRKDSRYQVVARNITKEQRDLI